MGAAMEAEAVMARAAMARAAQALGSPRSPPDAEHPDPHSRPPRGPLCVDPCGCHPLGGHSQRSASVAPRGPPPPPPSPSLPPPSPPNNRTNKKMSWAPIACVKLDGRRHQSKSDVAKAACSCIACASRLKGADRSRRSRRYTVRPNSPGVCHVTADTDEWAPSECPLTSPTSIGKNASPSDLCDRAWWSSCCRFHPCFRACLRGASRAAPSEHTH